MNRAAAIVSRYDDLVARGTAHDVAVEQAVATTPACPLNVSLARRLIAARIAHKDDYIVAGRRVAPRDLFGEVVELAEHGATRYAGCSLTVARADGEPLSLAAQYIVEFAKASGEALFEISESNRTDVADHLVRRYAAEKMHAAWDEARRCLHCDDMREHAVEEFRAAIYWRGRAEVSRG